MFTTLGSPEKSLTECGISREYVYNTQVEIEGLGLSNTSGAHAICLNLTEAEFSACLSAKRTHTQEFSEIPRFPYSYSYILWLQYL